MANRIEEARTQVLTAIATHSVDEVGKSVCPLFSKIVGGTRMKREFGMGCVIAVGYQDLDPDCLEATIQCIADAMPDGQAKTTVEDDLAFWREHRQEIMGDHGITPLTEE